MDGREVRVCLVSCKRERQMKRVAMKFRVSTNKGDDAGSVSFSLFHASRRRMRFLRDSVDCAAMLTHAHTNCGLFSFVFCLLFRPVLSVSFCQPSASSSAVTLRHLLLFFDSSMLNIPVHILRTDPNFKGKGKSHVALSYPETFHN